jgi:hypothetical protein
LPLLEFPLVEALFGVASVLPKPHALEWSSLGSAAPRRERTSLAPAKKSPAAKEQLERERVRSSRGSHLLNTDAGRILWKTTCRDCLGVYSGADTQLRA